LTAKLIVAGGPAGGQEFALSGRIIFNVGSDPSATVFLDDPKVAPNHCRLYKEDSRFTLFDVSGLGMTVNGKRVVKAVLQPGDRIQLGDSELDFSSDEVDDVATGAPAGAPTGAARPPGHRGVSSGDFRIDVQSGQAAHLLARAWLQCVEGNDKGKVFDLSEGNVWVIGRGHSADVTVMDIKASRAHCRVDRIGDTFYVNDLNSTNGTYVNGQQVERQVLARGDYVKIGYTIFAFQYETAEESASGRRPAGPGTDAFGGGAALPPPPPQEAQGFGSGVMPGAPVGANPPYPPPPPFPVGDPFQGQTQGAPVGPGAVPPPPGFGGGPPGLPPSPFGAPAPHPFGAPPPPQAPYGTPPPGPPPGFPPEPFGGPPPGMPPSPFGAPPPAGMPAPFDGPPHGGPPPAGLPPVGGPPPPPPHAYPGDAQDHVSVAEGLELDLSALDEDSDAFQAPPPADGRRPRLNTEALAAPALEDLIDQPPDTTYGTPAPVCFLCQHPIAPDDVRAGRFRRIHDNDYCLGCVDGL
jgi:pSer/pThr/pTyr-binding forkhead associated (FHA) protein